MRNPVLSRRRLLGAGAGVVVAGALGGCQDFTDPAGRHGDVRMVSAELIARPARVELGGPVVNTWAYGDTVPGPVVRARVGERLRLTVTNSLPVETAVYPHGLGVPGGPPGTNGGAGPAIAAGGRSVYELPLIRPGTFWLRPPGGLHRDRGLYAALVVEDPTERTDHDVEHVVVLDDWLDGAGRDPQTAYETLRRRGPLPGVDLGRVVDGMAPPTGRSDSDLLDGPAGDLGYPHYVINGRVPAAPASTQTTQDSGRWPANTPTTPRPGCTARSATNSERP